MEKKRFFFYMGKNRTIGLGRGDDKEGGFSVEDLMREREEKRKNQTL